MARRVNRSPNYNKWNYDSDERPYFTQPLDENYQALATAVIKQAIVDDAPLLFFQSEWYQLLTPWKDISGEIVYNQVKQNRKNGYQSGLMLERKEDERSEDAF